MVGPSTPVAVKPVGAAGGVVQSVFDGGESPPRLNATTRWHTRCSLASPVSWNAVRFAPTVPALVQVAAGSGARSTRNPSSLIELSIQVTLTVRSEEHTSELQSQSH